MYNFFLTLVFSLALGPDVKLLNAQEADGEFISMPSEQTTVFSQVTQTSPAENHLATAEGTTMKNTHPTVEKSTIKVEYTMQTSEENTMMPSADDLNTSALLTTPQDATIPVSTIITTYELSTLATPLEPTSQQEEETIMTNIITIEPPQTPSPSPTVPDPPALSSESPGFTNAPSPTEEKEETTDTLTTPTPTPTTTPTPTPTTTTTTIIIITPTQEQTMPITTDSNTITYPTLSTMTKLNGAESSQDSENPKRNWLIIAVIALVIFCILMILCVAIIIKRRKQCGKQQFGSMNGQRSKKKKGAEDDVWAGPVKLGGDCESPEEGDAQGEEKKTGREEVTGLSTFVTLEENGGVGRPGSPEVKKWEEKEPLLYMDEEGKEKGKEEAKSEDADATEGAGKTDTKEAEPNGGEAFCLTTAV